MGRLLHYTENTFSDGESEQTEQKRRTINFAEFPHIIQYTSIDYDVAEE